MNKKQKNNIDKNSIDKKRRLKKGSLGIAMTVAVVALIIGLNYLLTSVEKNVSTRINMDDKGYYDISGATYNAFASLPDDSFKAQIIFLVQRDVLASTKNESITMIWNLAEEYHRQFPDNIDVVYKDLNKDVAFVKKYINETRTNLTNSQVIIQGKYHARVISFNAFFTLDSNTGAVSTFQGELMYTSMILQSCIEKQPRALFTSNHGETFSSKIGDIKVANMMKDDDAQKESYINSVPLLQILSVAGFDIGTIDLSKEQIPEDTTAVFISSPVTDLEGFDPSYPNSKSEADKITGFVDKYKSLVVIVGKDTPELPNLQEMLWETYSIGYEAGQALIDERNSVAVDTGDTEDDVAYDGRSVIGKFSGGDNTFAASIYRNLSSSYKFVFRDAVRLKMKGEEYPDAQGMEASIKSYDTAAAYDHDKVAAKGEFPLIATYSKANTVTANYATGISSAVKYKKVFLIASSEFLSPIYASVTYGNRELMLGMSWVIISEEKDIEDVDSIGEIKVVIEDKTLSAEKLTKGQAYRYLRIFVIWIPLAVIAGGVIVWYRRRYA